MSIDDKLSMLYRAMDGEWVVERYSVSDDGKLRVHYRSMAEPSVEWSHLPNSDLIGTPKIGTVGLMAFVWFKEEEL